MTDNIGDDVVEDVEIYEGPPAYNQPQTNDEGEQDDEDEVAPGFGFMAKATNAIRTTEETLNWYRTHQDIGDIGFDPDGMCLKVCRTARNAPPKYLTAKQCQDATPEQYRVHKVRDLRKGMVLYFDDPSDSNRAGHIVTMFGRVAGFDPDSLDDVLTATNSVESNRLTIVRGSYFKSHWGDSFQFGAGWLNGIVLDVGEPKEVLSKVEKFHDTKPLYDLQILARAAKHRPAARRVLDQIMTQVNRLPDNPKRLRLLEFKRKVREQKMLDMRLLTDVVQDGSPHGRIKPIRDEIRRLLDTLPDE